MLYQHSDQPFANDINYQDDKAHNRTCCLTALYNPEQVYAIEKSWFDEGNNSYSLMQQAAWQMAHWINQHIASKDYIPSQRPPLPAKTESSALKAYVWVGSGNNGGDGWLVAHYLKGLGVEATVIEVAQASTPDARCAKKQALADGIEVYSFAELEQSPVFCEADVYIDALFGIGLDRAPDNEYARAIRLINHTKYYLADRLQVISVDIPSGVVGETGHVFDSCAVKADTTLCLVARKLGLHIKDGVDYCGQIVDMPLIPTVLSQPPVAWLQAQAVRLQPRKKNTHKGSFGHALIIGGNQIDGSQGMGGAAILSASTAFATGVGKLTVACHNAFHSSLIDSVPNAMSLDLHNREAVKELIKQADCIAIGMGLGRDDLSEDLFQQYLLQSIEQDKNLIIDADGLYHLATLADTMPEIIEKLISHTKHNQVWYTPHSGEAARLLNIDASDVEQDRLKALCDLHNKYQGSWLLKGTGSMVKTAHKTYVCNAGNPGMATAGMGDVLSGLAAGLLAQASLAMNSRSLQQAVMIHALAGDKLQSLKGTWAVQANDMPQQVGEVFKELSLG